jgi:hypothetical protein
LKNRKGHDPIVKHHGRLTIIHRPKQPTSLCVNSMESMIVFEFSTFAQTSFRCEGDDTTSWTNADKVA